MRRPWQSSARISPRGFGRAGRLDVDQFPGTKGRRTNGNDGGGGIVRAIDWRVFRQATPRGSVCSAGSGFSGQFEIARPRRPRPAGADHDELRRWTRGSVDGGQTLAALHRDGPDARVAGFGANSARCAYSVTEFPGHLRFFSVARRTREIGIRMAVGANRHDVVAMILRETAWLAGLGLGLGLLLSLAVGKVAGDFLYQVSALDPAAFIVIPPLLLALAACVIPPDARPRWTRWWRSDMSAISPNRSKRFLAWGLAS